MFQSVILCAFYLYFFPYPKMRKIFFTILHKSLKVFIMTLGSLIHLKFIFGVVSSSDPISPFSSHDK